MQVSPGKIMEEKLSYKEFLDRNDSWTMDDRDRGFDTQQAFKPMDVTVPNKFPDAAEMHWPGSFGTGLMDLTGELPAPQAKQVTPTASPGGGDSSPGFAVEELMGFEPAFDDKALPPKEAAVASPDATLMKEQKTKTPEPAAPDAGSSPVQEKEERKLSTNEHQEKETSNLSPHPKAEEVSSKPLPSPKGEERKEPPSPQAEEATTKPLSSQQMEGSKPSPILCAEEESKSLGQQAEHKASLAQGTEKVDEYKAPLGQHVQEARPTPPPAQTVEEALASPTQRAEKVAESKASPASREEPSSPSQPVEHFPVLERPDETKKQPSPSKPTDRSEEHAQLPPARSEEHLPEPTTKATELKESASFGEPKPDPKEPLPEKPALAPAGEDKPKKAPEPHSDPPVKLPQEEHPLELESVPQVRHANKSSEHRRSGRVKSARLPVTDASEELLTGFQAQKTHDQEERLVSREECGYIYGTSPRSKAPHRKAASQPFEFSEAPKGVLLESWDLEASAALKKKKKKPKQKRNHPARAVETWEENPERLRTPLFVSEPQKFEVPFAEPCKTTSASADVLRKETSMLGVGSELLDAPNLALNPAKGEQTLQTESSLQHGSGAKAGEFICMEAASHENLKSSRKEHLAEQNKPESPIPPPAQTSPVETDLSRKLEGHPPKNGETRSAVSKEVEIAPMKPAVPGGTVTLESTTSGKGLVEEKLQQPESGGKRERPGEEAAKSPAEVKTRGVTKGKRCPDKSKGRDPIALDPPLKAATVADPCAELSLGGSKESSPVKTEKLDGGSADVPSVLEMRSDSVKTPSPAGAIDSTKVPFTDVHKGGGSSPPEPPAGAIPRMVSDQPKKRGSDGRSKRAKDSSEQRLFTLEDQDKGAEEAKVLSGTGLPAKSTDVGFSSMKEVKTALGSEEVGKKRSGDGQSRRAAERSSPGPAFFLGIENSTGRLSAEVEQNRQTPKQAGGHEDTLAADVIKPQALAAPPLLEKPKGGAASKTDWVDFPSSAYPFISAAPVMSRECPAPPEADSQTKEASMSEKGKGPSEGLPLPTSKPKKSSSDGKSKKSGKSPSEQPFHPEATPENKPSRKTDIKEMDSAHKSPLPPDAPLLQKDQDKSQAQPPPTKLMEKTEGKGKVDLSTAPKPTEREQALLADQKTSTARLEPLVKSKEASSAESKQGATPEPLLEDTSCVLKTHAPATELAAVGQEVTKAGDSPSFSQHQGKGLDHPKKDAQTVGGVLDLPLEDRTSKGAEEGKNRKGRSSLEPSLLLGAKAEAHAFLGAEVDDQPKESSSARSRKEARGGGAKPAKRSSDGKSKMAAIAPERQVQAKALANEGPLPQGAGLEYTGEEMEFVDENRNIKSLPPGHPMLWEENTMRLFGSFALPGTGGLDEAAFRSQGAGCPFLEHAGKAAGALKQEQPFPPEILEDASRGDRKSQQEMQDNLVKEPGKEAVREASLLAKAGDEARGKRNKGKRPLSERLVEQNAPPEKDGVLGSILAQDGGTSLLDETQGSGHGFSDLAGKQKMPAAVQNAGEEGSGSVGQETNVPPTECPAPWENKKEVAALQALTEVLVGGNAQLGDSEKGPEQKTSKCLQSLGSEAGADKALEDVSGEEVASACEVKDPSQHHLEQDNVTESTCSPPVQAASKEEASRARDGQGLESEAGQGEELVLQAAADRGDQVARETKKEERTKAPEQIKGYMRPTKSRGLPPPPPPPRSVAQEYGRRRTAKSDALNLHRQERGVCLQLWSTGSNAYYSLCVRPGALA
ncbi:hypothetical protein lerEdw1_005971 [Lerista edwardsae]|nr:hypothetical protein lerEdw1_005971 [Lerista edwardsae]